MCSSEGSFVDEGSLRGPLLSHAEALHIMLLRLRPLLRRPEAKNAHLPRSGQLILEVSQPRLTVRLIGVSGRRRISLRRRPGHRHVPQPAGLEVDATLLWVDHVGDESAPRGGARIHRVERTFAGRFGSAPCALQIKEPTP